MAPMNRHFERIRRGDRVLARVRQRQLELALAGQVADSARYARMACRIRRYLGECSPCATALAG